MDMKIQDIVLSLLEIDLQNLYETINKLFAELQAKYDNDTGHIEKCKDFINVLEICKKVSLRADAIQGMGKATKLFSNFLEDTGINLEDLKNDDN